MIPDSGSVDTQFSCVEHGAIEIGSKDRDADRDGDRGVGFGDERCRGEHRARRGAGRRATQSHEAELCDQCERDG